MHYTTAFELEPAGDGTRISMRFGGAPVKSGGFQKLMWKLLGGIGLRATAKTMQKDLDDIARAAEARGA